MTTVYLSLGSNMGERLVYLEQALLELDKLPKTHVTAVSSYYETAPWGKTDQDPFLNACCQLETKLSPQELLSHCQEVEQKAGRERHEHWGPRTLDIDILLYGEAVIDEPNLTIPHPYLSERAFVLVPLADIAPHIQDPVLEQSILTLLDRLDRSDVIKLDN